MIVAYKFKMRQKSLNGLSVCLPVDKSKESSLIDGWMHYLQVRYTYIEIKKFYN